MNRSLPFASNALRTLAIPSALAVALMAGSAHANTVSGGLALTSDYVWRGITQTQGDPAVQASLKWAGESGFYASVWASNVEFAPELKASSEFDFTVGWAGEIADGLALDASVVHYRFPSTTADLNWTEAVGTLTWRGHYWATLAWSNEALGLDANGLYALIGARVPVGDTFRIEGTLGHYDVENPIAPDTYLHGQINAIWTPKANLDLRLSLHDTSDSADVLFGESLAGDRIEAAVSYAF